MEAAKVETDGPCCPICLEQFNIPRQLPCAHSFCERCLHSHITTEATKHKKLIYVKCLVCRNSASPSIKDRPTNEWATLFPVNLVLQSILPGKLKVDRLCHACNNEGFAALAEGFCVACKEAMCEDCLKFHRKQTLSKDHIILSLDELACNPENVMKLVEGFTCSEHHGEDIKYYCKDHKVSCCGSCFFDVHKICSNVIDLKKELTALLSDSKADEIIVDMKKIEIHLKTFMEINEACLNKLEDEANKMTDKIREVRKKINSVLDELEKLVKTEGNRIYKEEVIRKQDENHQCLSLIHAVKNSHRLLEIVQKYGSNLQKFLMAEKMRSQLQSYCILIGEKYEKTDTITVDVKFASPIESILSLSLSELGKVVTPSSSNTLPLTCLRRSSKDFQIEKVDVIDLRIPMVSSTPLYTDVSFVPGDRVMLADCNNNQCILLSSSYQFITSHTLTGNPNDMCVLDDQEVAVSLYNQNKIHILSMVGDVIRPVRMITTKYNCNAIAAAAKGEMVVNGYIGNNNGQWSLINTRGDVTCSHQYDIPQDTSSYLALNNTKTRVYISVRGVNLLLCFDIDGRLHFTYSPDNLKQPSGVAVDRYDNVYIVAFKSCNLHQLSPDGSVLRVISSGMPKEPYAVCNHKSKDMLIITNYSNRTKLDIYQLK